MLEQARHGMDRFRRRLAERGIAARMPLEAARERLPSLRDRAAFTGSSRGGE